MKYCKNCGHIIHQGDKYCGNCGAKQVYQRINVSFFIQESKEVILNTDNNRPLRTFLHMFTKPHVVCQSYLNGIRKRYINPFAYITIALSLFGVFLFFFSDNFIDAINTLGTPNDQNDVQVELQQKVNQFIIKYQSIVTFINIPTYALVFWIAFILHKKHNYLEHVIIVLYTSAHVSILSSLLYFIGIWFDPLFPILIGVVGSLAFVYYLYVYIRLYELSFWKAVLKILVTAIAFVGVLLFIGILVNFIMFATGAIDFEKFIEAEKAKRGVSYIASSFMNWTS